MRVRTRFGIASVIVAICAFPPAAAIVDDVPGDEALLEAGFTADAPCSEELCRARTGELILFTDTSSGGVSRRSWDFDVAADEASSGATARHAWASPGFYRVTLTVRGAGKRSTASRTFLVEAVDPAGTCVPDGATICLQDSRYGVAVEYEKPDGESGAGQVVHAGTNDSGLFSFFGRDNWEVLVKVLDGCAVNGRDWVFAASATDLGYVIRVTDTMTGELREFRNEAGRLARAVTDTSAFTGRCDTRSVSVAKAPVVYQTDCDTTEWDQTKPAEFHCGLFRPFSPALSAYFTNELKEAGESGSYAVTVDNVALTPGPVDIFIQGGHLHMLWNPFLELEISADQVVRLTYTKPTSGSVLTDVNGNEIASFGPVEIEKITDATPVPTDEPNPGGGGPGGGGIPGDGDGPADEEPGDDEPGDDEPGDEEPGDEEEEEQEPICPSALCLHEGRFEVDVEWFTAGSERSPARPARAATDVSGLLWFFEPDNWEMLIKVLDGCGVNGRYWVFAASATDVGFDIEVEDTQTGDVRRYTKSPGEPAAAMADLAAFPTACQPQEPASYWQIN